MFFNWINLVLDIVIAVSYFLERRCIDLGWRTALKSWWTSARAVAWTVIVGKEVVYLMNGGSSMAVEVFLAILAGILVGLRLPLMRAQWRFLKRKKQ